MNSFNELHGTEAVFKANHMYESLSNKGHDQMRTVIKVSSFFPHGLGFPLLCWVKENLVFVGAKVCFKASQLQLFQKTLLKILMSFVSKALGIKYGPLM